MIREQNDSCGLLWTVFFNKSVKKIQKTTSNSFYIVIREQNDSCEPVVLNESLKKIHETTWNSNFLLLSMNSKHFWIRLTQSLNHSKPLRISQPTPSQKLAAFVQFQKYREPLLQLQVSAIYSNIFTHCLLIWLIKDIGYPKY